MAAKSNLSETPTKVSPATAPRVSSKLSIRGLAKPEPGSPGTRNSVDRSLSSKPTIDRKASKPEPSSPATLRAARHSADGSLRASLTSKLAIDQRSPKAEPGSPSLLQGTRHLDDRSPRSPLNPKPKIEWRSPKSAMPSEKPQTRISRGSELQAQLNSAQEDLKKAKEQITLIEKEKARAIDELKEAQKEAEEANEKLREAFDARKRAEESSEIEKFRAVKLEQAGMEAANEELWNKIELVRSRRASSDVSSLCSTNQELGKVKHELATACDAKNQALNRADDATKTAEIQAEKVAMLSAELVRLKSLIDSEANENKEEIESLKQQLEEAKTYEAKLIEKEAFVEQLNVDLKAARLAETYANKVVEEWKSRVKELEMQIEEAKKLERSASESLDAVMKQLEITNKSLLDAESENASLEEKLGLMEMTISKQIMDLVESEHSVHMAKVEATEMTKSFESLKFELEMLKKEKTQALEIEKLVASSVQTLSEEKTELLDELEKSRDEIERSKKALESLASAIYQVSIEARDAKERLISSEKEHENYEAMLEDLRSSMKAANEKYETMLGDAKNEIVLLTTTIEQSRIEYHNSRTEWEQKEQHLLDLVKQWEQENSAQEKEISRLMNLLKRYEEEASTSKEGEAHLKESLEEAESEVIYMQGAFKEVETENMKLKSSLLDKETELQSVVQENEKLRAREGASLKKAEELSKLLEEATIKKKQSGVFQADGAKVETKRIVQDVESKGLTQQTKLVDECGNSSTKQLQQQQQQQQKKKKNGLLRKLASLVKKKKKGSNNQK